MFDARYRETDLFSDESAADFPNFDRLSAHAREISVPRRRGLDNVSH